MNAVFFPIFLQGESISPKLFSSSELMFDKYVLNYQDPDRWMYLIASWSLN